MDFLLFSHSKMAFVDYSTRLNLEIRKIEDTLLTVVLAQRKYLNVHILIRRSERFIKILFSLLLFYSVENVVVRYISGIYIRIIRSLETLLCSIQILLG